MGVYVDETKPVTLNSGVGDSHITVGEGTTETSTGVTDATYKGRWYTLFRHF